MVNGACGNVKQKGDPAKAFESGLFGLGGQRSALLFAERGLFAQLLFEEVGAFFRLNGLPGGCPGSA